LIKPHYLGDHAIHQLKPLFASSMRSTRNHTWRSVILNATFFKCTMTEVLSFCFRMLLPSWFQPKMWGPSPFCAFYVHIFSMHSRWWNCSCLFPLLKVMLWHGTALMASSQDERSWSLSCIASYYVKLILVVPIYQCF
jgi:hypothetical protein